MNPLNYKNGKRIGKKNRLKNKLVKKRCRYCKATENLTIDHKVPVTRGGSDHKSNLQVLCMTCNGTKSALSHNDVKRLFKWFLTIQESRINHGKKPYTLQ